MTTFTSSSAHQQTTVSSNTSNTTNNDNSNAQLKQQQYKLASNGYTGQRPSLGLHQDCALSAMGSPHYTTARQQVQKTGMTASDNGMAPLDEDYDEDDVEIIMHDDDDHRQAYSPTCTSSGLDGDSTPAVTAPCQEQRQSNTDHPEAPIDHPLQRQLEYYFSRQNLANDSYLVSQMDPDLYVPIATIAKFKRVLDLTFDMDHIVATLRRSSVVTVDESGTKVKPNMSIQRTIVILRDVPESTEQEIRQFLQSINSLPIINIKNEYADMWYITFKSEDDALKMMSDTRGKLFKGQYVAARMKSEPVVGSIQARKSALQAGSSSSSDHTTGTYFNPGRHTYSNHINSNMKGYVYNDHRYSYNSHTPYTNRYPPHHSHHSSSTYPHYIPNGTQRGGRYMNNHVNRRNHNNNNSSSSNSNNRRSTTGGGRGWYKNNNYNGMGQHTSWTDHATYHTSTQNQLHQPLLNTTTTTENEQRSDIDQSAPPSESTNDATRAGLLAEPISPSAPLLSHPSQSSNTYHQSSNHHRLSKNGTSGHWQQERQKNNPSHYHSHPLGSTGSAYSSHVSPHKTSQRYKTSPSWKNGSANTSAASLQESTHRSTDSIVAKHSETTAIQAAAPRETSTSTPSPALLSASSSTNDAARQTNGEQQKDTTKNKKSKWDKKKKNKRQTAPLTAKEHKHQEQPDLQSGTFFPPLPGAKTGSRETTDSADMASLLEKRLSIADIVKKGPDSAKKQQAAKAAPSKGDSSSSSSSSSSHSNAAKQHKKRASPNDTEATKQPATTPTQKEDLFPLLCPVQDSLLPSSSFSYADMLKKKEHNETT